MVEVDDGSGGNITAPPIIPASARLQGQSDGDAERIEAIRFRASDSCQAGASHLAEPAARRARSGRRRRCGRAVVHFHGDVGQPAHRSGGGERARFRRAAGRASRRSRAAAARRLTTFARSWPGYAPAQLQIKVTEAPNQQFSLTLAKLPGRLRIDVPAAARVTVDGKEAGNAPGEFELAAGKHSVAIAAERYQPFSADVDVEGLGKTQTFKPQLVPGWGVVTVTSEPAGAQLLVNGEPRGVTPLTDGNHGGRRIRSNCASRASSRGRPIFR